MFLCEVQVLHIIVVLRFCLTGTFLQLVWSRTRNYRLYISFCANVQFWNSKKSYIVIVFYICPRLSHYFVHLIIVAESLKTVTTFKVHFQSNSGRIVDHVFILERHRINMIPWCIRNTIIIQRDSNFPYVRTVSFHVFLVIRILHSTFIIIDQLNFYVNLFIVFIIHTFTNAFQTFILALLRGILQSNIFVNFSCNYRICFLLLSFTFGCYFNNQFLFSLTFEICFNFLSDQVEAWS